jgi:hypothetical protein
LPLTNAFDPNDGLVGGTIMVASGAMFVAALAVPEAFGSHGVVFGLAFFVVALMQVSLYALSARGDRDLLQAILRVAPSSIAGATLIAVAGFVHGSLKPLLNVGLWGLGSLNDTERLRKSLGLEDMLRKLGGMKILYANTYYTEKAFWEVYDGEWYRRLRAKYRATSLPSVWHKVATDPMKEARVIDASWWLWLLCFWPLGGLFGMYRVWRGKKDEAARRAVVDVVELKT